MTISCAICTGLASNNYCPCTFAEIYHNVVSVHSYIVLRETQGFSCGDIVARNSSGHHRYHGHNSRRRSETSNPPRLSTKNMTPLTEEECLILDAIDDLSNRYKATSGLLKWGVGLKVGDTVLARLPDKSGRGYSAGAQQDQYATAIIRWTGLVEGRGYRFGVEIMVIT